MTRTRPLLGEPLALDLVNTAWVEQGAWVDFFDDFGGTESWLAEHGLPGDAEQAREPLVMARQALRTVLSDRLRTTLSDGEEQPGATSGEGEALLDAVLEHGSRRPRLRGAQPYEKIVVDHPSWHAAWLAAADLVRLMGERPERIRKCSNPACVLWFYDTSKNGSRRWCSMEACGNRAKSNRFQKRHRSLD
ncbi:MULTISPECIES: CGNR zinc finger domain-containing protein [Streptosporangium]|uniref:RNA-binding Zn ribbon-like protein n=1 Tax=Streptosporangium brasiliense TaxID=47480 RepID=A0ABT9R4Y4_9ACTN|nr:CGNR zinc finger domain-containing protein [Streptosporangium brasiliense]MDP9864303.1 putative RNA-binding Zn ribbon-like protein [Streptosporangium brasiliense]